MTFGSQCSAATVAASMLLLISCGKTGDPQPKVQQPAGPPQLVRAAYVELRPMGKSIRATGTLAPQESATLSTKVSGRIMRLEVDLGSSVKRGDLIAQVEPRDYELRVSQAAAAMAQARAALGLPLEGENDAIEAENVTSVRQARAVLEEAARTLERAQNLTQARIVSASDLDSAEAAHKVALTRYETALEEARARAAALAQRRAELDIARKQLSDTAVLAPFDGAIQSRLASVGEYVATGTPIVTLVQTDPLRLRLEVPERESLLVRAGQTVQVTVGRETNLFAGRIARLSPALNENTRMLLVEADVPSQGALRAGLYAKAEIIVDENASGLSVPASALVTFAGIQKVITYADGKAVEKPVTTGRRGPDWIEIRSGVAAGIPVILDPGGLRNGQPVSIKENPGTLHTSAVPVGVVSR